MAPVRIRLLALDVDGTLLDSQHRLSTANRDAVRALAARGVRIALATGRRPSFVLPIAEELGCDPVLIACNGAVVRAADGAIVQSRLLGAARAAWVLGAAAAWRAHAVLTFPIDGPGELVMESAEPGEMAFPGWFQRNRERIRFCRPLEAALESDPIQIMYGGSVESMRRAVAALGASDCSADIRIARTIYPQRDLAIVDILHPEVSKGAALARWAVAEGYQPAEIMAIGDNFNDLEMLEFAAHAVVMGNADASLHRPGWRRTADNDHDGVALALAELLR